MRLVETEIDIATPSWRVWLLLTDFAAYPAWNPFLTQVDGRPELDAWLSVRVEPPGRSALTLKPKVVALETGREFRFRSRLMRLPWLFDCDHAYELERMAGGRATRLRHAARFYGLVTPLAEVGGVLETTRLGFEAMDAALKALAEGASVRRTDAGT